MVIAEMVCEPRYEGGPGSGEKISMYEKMVKGMWEG